MWYRWPLNLIEKHTGRNTGFDRVLASEEDVLLEDVLLEDALIEDAFIRRRFIRRLFY